MGVICPDSHSSPVSRYRHTPSSDSSSDRRPQLTCPLLVRRYRRLMHLFNIAIPMCNLNLTIFTPHPMHILSLRCGSAQFVARTVCLELGRLRSVPQREKIYNPPILQP